MIHLLSQGRGRDPCCAFSVAGDAAGVSVRRQSGAGKSTMARLWLNQPRAPVHRRACCAQDRWLEHSRVTARRGTVKRGSLCRSPATGGRVFSESRAGQLGGPSYWIPGGGQAPCLLVSAVPLFGCGDRTMAAVETGDAGSAMLRPVFTADRSVVNVGRITSARTKDTKDVSICRFTPARARRQGFENVRRRALAVQPRSLLCRSPGMNGARSGRAVLQCPPGALTSPRSGRQSERLLVAAIRATCIHVG